MKVEVDEIEINIKIIIKNNKNIYFRFKDDGFLYVYCNKFVTKDKIERLIIENKNAILKMYEKQNKQIDSDRFFYYLGKAYVVVISDIDDVLFDDDYIFVKSKESLEKFYLKECKRLFAERVSAAQKAINNVPDFKLRLRKMKTRWGVCNVSKRIITLNTELLKYELDLLDYVIVHEMCHFFEANHSSRFWQHVEEYYPNYKLARKRLREGLK